MARVNNRTDGVSAWFDALPPITKAYMCALFFTTLGFTIGLINPYHLALLWPRVIQKFEIWRLVTHYFFMGKFSLHWVFTVVFLHNYGVALEVGTFVGRTADYLWIYVFGGLVYMALSLLGHFGVIPDIVGPFSAEIMCFMILFVWSRNFPEQSTSIWGIIKLQSFYLPFGMMALIMLMGGDFMSAAIGIFIGHVKNAVARAGIGSWNPAEVTAPMGAQARAFTGRGRRLNDDNRYVN